MSGNRLGMPKVVKNSLQTAFVRGRPWLRCALALHEALRGVAFLLQFASPISAGSRIYEIFTKTFSKFRNCFDQSCGLGCWRESCLSTAATTTTMSCSGCAYAGRRTQLPRQEIDSSGRIITIRRATPTDAPFLARILLLAHRSQLAYCGLDLCMSAGPLPVPDGGISLLFEVFFHLEPKF